MDDRAFKKAIESMGSGRQNSRQQDHHEDDLDDSAPYTKEGGRVYVHTRCGGATRISGNDFVTLCDPFAIVAWTVCASCRKKGSLDQFAWADTGERLDQYVKRNQVPPLTFCLLFLAVMVIFTCVGYVGGYVVLSLLNPGEQPPTNKMIGSAGLGAITGFVVMLVFSRVIWEWASGKKSIEFR